MTAMDLDRECRRVWGSIADETSSRKAQRKKIARLYLICRDIQQAVRDGAGFRTVWAIVDLIASVARRSYGLRTA